MAAVEARFFVGGGNLTDCTFCLSSASTILVARKDVTPSSFLRPPSNFAASLLCGDFLMDGGDLGGGGPIGIADVRAAITRDT